MALAYERLPQQVKDRIAPLRARHSIEASFGAAMPIEKRLALHAQFPDAEHPVVRTHPETGEKILFVNAFTSHFTNFHNPDNVRFGQDANPGASLLLGYLISQAYIPEFQVRWRWKKNSVAMWDNRCTQHLVRRVILGSILASIAMMATSASAEAAYTIGPLELSGGAPSRRSRSPRSSPFSRRSSAIRPRRPTAAGAGVRNRHPS